MKNNSISESDIFALCQSDNKFPIDFDLAWRWIGYSIKKDAKQFLIKNFELDIDYRMLQPELGTLDHPRPNQRICLTIEAFKTWAMMAQTAKGREVRKYFLECERKLEEIVAQQSQHQPQSQLEPIDIFALDKGTIDLLHAWKLYGCKENALEMWEKLFWNFPHPDEFTILDDRLKEMPMAAIRHVVGLHILVGSPLLREYRDRFVPEPQEIEDAAAAQQFQAQLNAQLAPAASQQQLAASN